ERRHDLLTSLLREHFAGLLQPTESSGGTHMAALLTPGQPPDTRLADRALAEGVRVGPVSRWGIDRPCPNGLLFRYRPIPADRIQDGVAVRRPVICSRLDWRRTRRIGTATARPPFLGCRGYLRQEAR